MKRAVFILVFAYSFILISAQVPQGFNYQAIARDLSGNPVINTTMPVRITIQADSLGTSVIWQELHSSVTTNSLGMINLIHGKGAGQTPSTVASFSAIDWSITPKFLKTEINYSGWRTMGVSRLWSVPYAMIAGDLDGPVKKLSVAGETSLNDEALFEVRNKAGQLVFAVYNEGVRVYVSDGAKGLKGGFAVGGFGTDKAESTKYLFVGKDSVRIYLDTNPLTKKMKGGFAVGGYDLTKGVVQDYLDVNSDSVRIYIDSNPATKGLKGGFAVGGYDMVKGTNTNYMNVNTDASGIINPSQNRILWYPLKNAFLTGKVLVENKDSVGLNSFASGYESKARGQYSQALGYQAVARGDYSTAIGKNAMANSINSFAFGESAYAGNAEGYAIGRGAVATGYRSFAFGSAGVDKDGNPTDVARAQGDYSFAIGQGSRSVGRGSFSLGIADTTRGDYSTSIGYLTSAGGNYSTAIGHISSARGQTSTALGMYARATGDGSTAIGAYAYAKGNWTVAIGYETKAAGFNSTAIGCKANSPGWISTAFGFETRAKGMISTAMGNWTTAAGDFTTSLGNYTLAKSFGSMAIGQFNDTTCSAGGDVSWIDTDPLFIAGNGTDNLSRSNAFTVLKNGSVGIGNSAPVTRLDISGGNNWDLVNGNGDLRIGNSSYRLKIGIALAGGGAGGVGIMQHGQTGHYNVLSLGAQGSYLLFVNGNTQGVGIGTDNPGYKLTVNGTAWCSSGAWTGSDIRWKRNITVLDNVLSRILSLQAVNYDLRTDEFPEMGFDSYRQIGLIAQDVEKVFPLLVTTDINGFKAVAYDKLSAVLVEGIKEQQKQIESFRSENENLKTLLKALQEKVDRIEVLLK